MTSLRITLDVDPGSVERMRARFLAKVTKTDSCWLWTGYLDHRGYGRFSIGGRKGIETTAQNAAYRLFVGPIARGLEIDHLCRNPSCVNPCHLEAVTHRENILRSSAPPGRQARQTHCLRGHLFDATNTRYELNGSRSCRKCCAFRQQQRRRRLCCGS